MQLPINALLLGLGEIARDHAIRSFRLAWKTKAPGKVVFTLIVEPSETFAEDAGTSTSPVRAADVRASSSGLATCDAAGQA